MREIVLATGNRGKVTELQHQLAPLGWQVRPQSEWQFEDADETGTTFVENAIIKARHAAQHTGLSAIADDSGLAIDILHGRPGVYSARFAGEHASDRDNIAKVLEEVAPQHRLEKPIEATFHCVLVYLNHQHDPTPLICHGQWHGQIISKPEGEQGFGYDPIFWVPEKKCTAAQLSLSEKQQLSHRGKALAQLLNMLSKRSL